MILERQKKGISGASLGYLKTLVQKRYISKNKVNDTQKNTHTPS